MSLPKTAPNTEVLNVLISLVPSAIFKSGRSFYWSPDKRTVTYNPEALTEERGVWSIVHEAAHAFLEHKDYKNDFELLTLEVAAWEQAKVFGKEIGYMIDENHIQDCLDTYRDWLHKRSTCPTCGSAGLQHSKRDYRCHNCLTAWEVSQSRFCRPYRRKQSTQKEKSPYLHGKTTFR